MKQQKSIVFLSTEFDDLPNPHLALDEPDGLVAVSADLHPARLIFLYQYGFFPWYSEPDPIFWWHPSERCVLTPSQFHCSRSLKKSLKRFKHQEQGEVRINHSFKDIIQHCSDQRKHQEGTWISEDIIEAFLTLYEQGYAHSIETWSNGKLIGGFYGIAMGSVFFGESMFSLAPNASKYALYAFCQEAEKFGIQLIDCQVESEHLLSLGATLIPREEFIEQLAHCIPNVTTTDSTIQTAQDDIRNTELLTNTVVVLDKLSQLI